MNLSVKNKIEPLAITLVNILARGSHLLFFIFIGNKYGASNTTDAVFFLLAPLMVLISVASGAAETIIMPAFHKADNADTARYLFVYSIKKIILFVFPVSVIVIILFSIMKGFFDPLLMVILLPVPLLGSLYSLKAGVLNASNRFRSAISGPLFGGFVAVSFLLFAPKNIYCFGLSFLLFESGKIAGIWFLSEITTGGHPIQSDLGDSIVKWGSGNARLQIIASFILALVYPIDVWFASTLEIGSVTFVEYANKLWNIIPLLFVGHIAVTYSSFSKANICGGRGKLHVHSTAIRYGMSGVAVSLLVILLLNHIISFIYGFGKMNVQQQLTLAKLLNCYLLGAGAYAGALVYVRAMSAIGRVDLLLVVACLGFVCNVVSDIIFIRVMGLNGIGFATSIVYCCNYLALAYLYEKIRKKKYVAV